MKRYLFISWLAIVWLALAATCWGQTQTRVPHKLPFIDVSAPPYRANGFDANDDTTAVQAAITAATNGATIYFPAATEYKIGALSITKPITLYLGGATYTVSGTWTFASTNNVNLRGSGWGSTILSWAGNSTDPMFALDDVGRFSEFSDFKIVATSSFPLATAFRLRNITGGTVTPTARTFKRLMVDGTNGQITDGFHWTSTGGTDANNDQDTLQQVHVANYSQAACHIGHSQSHAHKFRDCTFAANGFGTYGVWNENGSFIWTNGGGGGHTDADIFVSSHAGTPLLAENLTLENSARFYNDGGASSAIRPTTFRGIRWRLGTGTLPGDNRVVQFRASGPLIVIGSSFQATTSSALEINASGITASESVAIAIGNEVMTTLADPYTGGHWVRFGNIYNVDNGTTPRFDSYIEHPTVTFTASDTTPSVRGSNLWRTNNGSATTITQFDDGVVGQRIMIRAGDANTTITHGTNIFLKGAANKTLANNETIVLVMFTAARWDEI